MLDPLKVFEAMSLLGALTDELKQDLAIPVDPLMFVERHVYTIASIFPSMVEDRRKLMEETRQIIEISRDACIITGRHAEPISMASLLISLAARMHPQQDVLKRSTVKEMMSRCQLVGSRTVEIRIRELLAVLEEQCSKLLPQHLYEPINASKLHYTPAEYSFPFMKKRVLPNLGLVLQFRDLMERQKGPRRESQEAKMPPSFVKSQESRLALSRDIFSAKMHLMAVMAGGRKQQQQH